MPTKFSIKWVILTYCLFVWFQYVPTFLLKGLIGGMIPNEVNRMIAVGLVWLFVVAFLVGYRSSGTAVWETTIGSILYVLTILFLFERFWLAPMKNIYVDRLTGLTLLVGALVFAGSWLGGKMFQLSARQRGKTVSP